MMCASICGWRDMMGENDNLDTNVRTKISGVMIPKQIWKWITSTTL